LQKGFGLVELCIFKDLKMLLESICQDIYVDNRFENIWDELKTLFEQEPEQNNNQLLLVFKKKSIVGLCAFSVLKNHEGISLLIRKQHVKWSRKEYIEILSKHLLYVCD
jgi:hypothetical protein